MRRFYLAYPSSEICQTLSGKFKNPLKSDIKITYGDLVEASPERALQAIAGRFLLTWSAYVSQLDPKINTQFYERTALSRDKVAMLKRVNRTIPLRTFKGSRRIQKHRLLKVKLEDMF